MIINTNENIFSGWYMFWETKSFFPVKENFWTKFKINFANKIILGYDATDSTTSFDRFLFCSTVRDQLINPKNIKQK